MRKSLKAPTTFFYLFLLGVLCLQILFWMSPEHETKLRVAYIWPLAVAAMLYVIYTGYAHSNKHWLLGPLISFWLLLTCAWNGDPYLLYNQKFILGIFLGFGCFLPAFMLATEKQRTLGLKVFGIITVLLATILSCAGLYVTLFGHAIQSPFSNTAITIADHRLYVFQLHPNEIGCIFAGALFWALYLAADSNRMWLKILLIAACLPLYAGIALTVSWTSKLAVGAGLGLVCMLWTQHRFQKKVLPLRIAIHVFSLMVATAIAVLGFSGVVSLTGRAAERLWTKDTTGKSFPTLIISANAKQETTIASTNTSPPQQDTKSTQPVTPKERDVLKNLSTFTGRTEIWQSGFDSIRRRPATLLLGMTDGQVARVPLATLNREIYHMHNAWIEMLLLGGLPGLLLYLLFTILLVNRCIFLYFKKDAKMSHRLLAIAPAILLIHALMETYPSFAGTSMDFIFFLLSGAVISYVPPKINSHKERHSHA